MVGSPGARDGKMTCLVTPSPPSVLLEVGTVPRSLATRLAYAVCPTSTHWVKSLALLLVWVCLGPSGVCLQELTISQYFVPERGLFRWLSSTMDFLYISRRPPLPPPFNLITISYPLILLYTLLSTPHLAISPCEQSRRTRSHQPSTCRPMISRLLSTPSLSSSH